MRRIVVQWGDGAVSTLRYRPGVEAVVGQESQLPPGTYRLNHAYVAPEHRGPFDRFVLVRAEDASGAVDFAVRKITLTPRYRVTNYRTTISLASKCDSIFESRSEFDITQYVGQDAVNAWRWEPPESSITGTVVLGEFPFLLEGSIVSRDLTVADGMVPVRLELIERDPFVDDPVPSIVQNLSASQVSAHVEGTAESDSSGCAVNYRYDREVTLVVPLPSYGQTVVFEA
jgi:hypothetical protein